MRVASDRRSAIYYATSSERLARDVQSLLLRLGITARLGRVPQVNSPRDQSPRPRDRRAGSTALRQRIGAVGTRRQATLDAIVAHLATRREHEPRCRPAHRLELARQPALATSGITTRGLQAGLDMAYCGSTLYKTNLSRERAERVAAAVGGRNSSGSQTAMSTGTGSSRSSLTARPRCSTSRWTGITTSSQAT